MDNIESSVTVEQSVKFLQDCIERHQPFESSLPRMLSLAANLEDSPTKELDALMVGDTLLGYGDNLSLDNTAMIEDIVTVAKLMADNNVAGTRGSRQWYADMISNLEAMGCFVGDSGYVHYSESSKRVDMNIVLGDVLKGVVDGIASKIPGAKVLTSVTDTTINALKDDKEKLRLFESSSKTPTGARLTIIPIDQRPNGLVYGSAVSFLQSGSSSNGGIPFISWSASAKEIFNGKSYFTFNPARYSRYKDLVEDYLEKHRKKELEKRFSRKK